MYVFPLRLKKLVKVAFSVGGSIEESDCLPSTFKILSEWFNIKKKFRANPQHTHQSLSKLPSLEISVSLLDLKGSVITVSSERQHRFYTVDFLSRGRLIAQLCPLATFALHYLKSLSIVRYISKQTSLGTVNAGLSDIDVLSRPLMSHPDAQRIPLGVMA